MKNRILLKKKIELFYEEIMKKRNMNEEMRTQTYQEFELSQVKRLNKKYNVKMFSTKIQSGKAFAAEQKTKEFKSKSIERRLGNRIKPNRQIQKATNKLNKAKSAKYGLNPEEIESKVISDEQFKDEYDFYRLQKVKQDAERRERFDINKDIKQRKKLREPLDLGESVYVLAERMKKKEAQGKLYKSSTENKPFFNKN